MPRLARFLELLIRFAAQRVALLLIHALVKAEKTEMALKARGFQLHDVKKTQDKS